MLCFVFMLESIDNFATVKAQTNVAGGGRNSLLRSTNEPIDNINRLIKRINRTHSMHKNSQIRLGTFLNVSDIIEQSLKQIDEYRLKIKSSLLEKLTNKPSNQLNENNQIKTNTLINLPQRPKTPIELIGKTNESDLINLLKNSNIDKIDGNFILFN